MANRRGQRQAAGGQPNRRPQEHPGLQDTYHLRGRPSPPLNDLHSTTWWSHREEPSESTTSYREQLTDKEQHIARLQSALRREREKSSSLQSRYSQQGVELRRREQHSVRLRERLTERPRERGPSMELLNPIKRDQPARPARTNGRTEEAALRAMLERREAELREAMKLRHKLATLLHALRAEMERSLLDPVDEDPGDKTLVQSEQLLGDHVTGGVVQAWKSVQRRLGDLFSQGHASVGTDQEKLLAQLQTELDQSQQLIREQQQLLQDNVLTALPESLTDGYFLEDWERLQAQRAELELQRCSFKRERWAFTDAAIRLGHEVL
ncbi:afadin- and alpha-actinin-binding protein isoform X2 [Esox lucius]|uniref:afadin- and alpha-actinin-binding protein isoform X2 n=1 Tax=Esox lucius TaxID=8010 RepID=UPI000576821E|nr:afadin- and alpha-actinin-binding protein isoform X2 [Esox lucius]